MSEGRRNLALEMITYATAVAVLDSESGSLAMKVPASGAANKVASDDSSQVFSGDGDTSVAVQSTEEGLRALIHIDSAGAPERYKFEIGGDVASLEPSADGGVVALNSAHEIIAVAPAPWAVDANGTRVPTHFEVDGTDLYQVVDHVNGEFEYGIVLDPWWNPFSWDYKKILGSAKAATKSARSWLGKNSKWIAGKAWSASKKTVRIAGRPVKVLAKKAGPFGLVLCATGAGWAWYRSDANGWVRVGDTVGGCFL